MRCNMFFGVFCRAIHICNPNTILPMNFQGICLGFFCVLRFNHDVTSVTSRLKSIYGFCGN